MTYFDDYDIDELKFLKDQFVQIANGYENRLNILTSVIDDINNTIERKNS